MSATCGRASTSHSRLIWWLLQQFLLLRHQTMQLLAMRGGARARCRMADDETQSARDAEQVLMGRALRALRDRQGLSQGAAGKACEPAMSSQAWQKYEAGERKMGRDTVERLTRALGAGPEDLLLARSRILGDDSTVIEHYPPHRGFAEAGARFVLPVWGRPRAGAAGPQVYDAGEPERYVDLRNFFSPSGRVTAIAGESMVPWASSGALIGYDVDVWPKRDEGCVVELNSGEILVKLYRRVDGSTLFVEELSPERRELRFALKEVKGVYAVTFRSG